MEHFGSRDETTREASLAEVDRSDLYIGILGGRYGSGITHDEYRRARERRLHCLIYLKDEAVIGTDQRDAEPGKAEQLEAFKEAVRVNHLLRAHFGNPDELAKQVAIDLHRWLFDAMRTQATVGYPLLADFMLEFRPLIAEALRNFVGRESVFAAMEELAHKHCCGYLVIVADAGLGKTALAAAVAARLDTPAFFCSVAGNLTRPHQCLEHLCADLIQRYDLPHDHLPPRAGENSHHFTRLLAEAADKAAEAGLPLWVVVDGLDEADDLTGGRNPLLLPPALPANAFILATQRPTHLRLVSQPGTPLREMVIRADDPMQRADMEAYLRGQAERPEIVFACSQALPPVTPEGFVRLLAEAARGNFKYAEYVIADIMEGEIGYRPFVPNHLPGGLERYYEQFWGRMGLDQAAANAWEVWSGLYRPVLALLGVAAEPVGVDWLAFHSGRRCDEIQARVLRPWRRFLVAAGTAGSERWCIVHKSFADFLESKPELDLPGFHGQLATTYLEGRWPPAHAEYRQRYLARHLRRAHRIDELFALIGRRDWFDAQLEADPSGTLFLDDVEQAWGAAREAPPAPGREVRCALSAATVCSLSSNLPPELIGALVQQGVWNTEVAFKAMRQMPDREQALLVLDKIVRVTADIAAVRKAIEYARGMATARRYGQVLAPLVAGLARLGHPEEAFAQVGAEGDAETRARLLVAIVPHLDKLMTKRAIEEAMKLAEDEKRRREVKERRDGNRVLGMDWHVEALAEILRYASLECADELRRRCETLFRSGWAQARLLRSLVASLLAGGDPARALAWAGEIDIRHERAACLADMVESLPSAQRDAVSVGGADDALAALVDWPDPENAKVLTRLLPHVPTEHRNDALLAALQRISGGTMMDGEILAALAPAFGDEVLLERAVEVARHMKETHDQRVALGALAARAVPLLGAAPALALATRGLDSYDGSQAVIALLPHLVRAGFVNEALQAVRDIGREHFRPEALEAVAQDLPAESIDEAMTIAEALPDRKGWRRAAGALAGALARHGLTERALSLLRRVRDGAEVQWRLQMECAVLQMRGGGGAMALKRCMRLRTEPGEHAVLRLWRLI